MHMDDATRCLKECEAELRRLVSEAAADGDYETVLRLTACAKQVAATTSSLINPGRAQAQRRSSPAGMNGCAGPKDRANSDGYPRFGCRRDHLIRVGPSKDGNSEYEHRTAKPAVDALASAVLEAGREGRVFTIEDCQPVVLPADGSEVPSYQVYNVMAWLKKMGLVDQHGRQGYSICKPQEFMEQVETAWNTLAEI
jgi:hypothetical protein